MAPSCRKAWRWLAWALAAGAAAAVPAAQAAAPAPAPLSASGDKPITVDAASSEVDYRTNTVEFTQVVITQGTCGCRPTTRTPPG